MTTGKSFVLEALGNASKNLKVETIEIAKEKKSKGGMIPVCCDDEKRYYKPSLHITNKDLSTIDKYKAGDKVCVVIECTVTGTDIGSSLDAKGKLVKRFSCGLDIDSFSDITPEREGNDEDG